MSCFFLIPVSIGLGLTGLCAFFWAMRHEQYEDLAGAAARILIAPDTRSHPKLRRRHAVDNWLHIPIPPTPAIGYDVAIKLSRMAIKKKRPRRCVIVCARIMPKTPTPRSSSAPRLPPISPPIAALNGCWRG